jgi:hypothetical protein
MDLTKISLLGNVKLMEMISTALVEETVFHDGVSTQ